MTSLETEYEKLFTKFYSDLFKFQNGKKTNLRCSGCDSKKRFIIDNDKLTYSCGPSNSDNPKCGKQYTIILPKYINYKTFQEIYDEKINGSFKYLGKDNLQYDLKSLSQRMDVKKELDIQKKIIKESSDNLDHLIKDYIEINKLNGYIETLETLSEKRYKNSIEKKKLMKLLNEEDLSEPEKIEIRKKYAQLISENKEFIDMIIELRKPNQDFIMINKPEIIIHKKQEDNEEEIKEIKEDINSKLIDIILDNFKNNDGILTRDTYKMIMREYDYKTKWEQLLFISLQEPSENNKRPWKLKLQEKYGSIIKEPKYKDPDFIELTDVWKKRLLKKQTCSKAHPSPPCLPGKEVPEGKHCCYNENKPKKDSPKPEPEPEHEPKKGSPKTDEYSFDKQVKMLIDYYKKVDPNKTEADVIRIVNNRRPKDKPKGTRIPTKPWLELCDKLNKKYNIHPLK